MDQTINIIRLHRPNGTPIALIANYPIHGTVLGYNGKTRQGNASISGDLPGVVGLYVEHKLGELQRISPSPSSYVLIERTWHNENRGRLEPPMEISASEDRDLPDDRRRA